MSPESIAFRQKRRIKNARNKYMNPGALVQLSCSRTTTRSCADVGMKRVILESKEEMDKLHQNEVIQDSIPTVSPVRVYLHPATEVSKQPKQPQTPKTQHAVNSDGLSRLESLPMDLLVKILCYLHHDQLRAVFHVCQQVRTAVLLARKQHFNYTTPDRSRQGMCRNRTPVPSEHWPFVRKEGGKGMWVSSPHTPRAPRQGPRPPRLHIMDMKQISAVLFQESTLSPRRIAPPGLPRPLFKAVASTRVLIYEDELCQAVTHNKLR